MTILSSISDYIFNDELNDLYKRAKEKLQAARLELLSAETAVLEIETTLARRILAEKGVFGRDIGKNVFVDFKDNDNCPCIYEGCDSGRIKLRHITKKGKPYKDYNTYKWEIAHHIRPRR